MKNTYLLYAFVGLFLLGGGTAVYTMTRGLRNNNPGNIRRTSTVWQGMAPEQTDSDYITFVSPEYGIRALSKVLDTYKSAYGLDTVREIISRWAPPNENDTEAYIRSVASQIGVGADVSLSAGQKLPLIKAIIKHENGLNPYSDTQIIAGMSLA